MAGEAKLPPDLQAALDAALRLVDVAIRISTCTHWFLGGTTSRECAVGPLCEPPKVKSEWWIAVGQFDDAWQRAQAAIEPVRAELRTAQSGRVKCGPITDTAFEAILDLGGKLHGDLAFVSFEPPPGTPPPPWGALGTRDERLRDMVQILGLDKADWNELRSALTLDAERAAEKRPKKRAPRRATHAELNQAARAALKGKPPRSGKRWSVRTLANAIGCSAGKIATLPAWQAYAEERALKRTHKKPGAVGLTDKVLENEGEDDPEIQRLIAEQTADYEESPLVPARRKPRRRREV